MPPKFIFVLGGVLSGLGKGVVTSSIGKLLKSEGYDVTAIKIDPYINLDAGTLRPTEHGEVWVTQDGGEIDQDLGNYERFLNTNIPKQNNITTGQIYLNVIEKERRLEYGGRDVEVIPDIPNEIMRRIYQIAEGHDFVLVEVGGTTGDIENLLFLYAIREIGRKHPSVYIFVTYLPFLRNVGELKTKPTQHAISRLRETGIFPDFVVTRAEVPTDRQRRWIIAQRCFVDEENVIDDPDLDNIYEVPLLFRKQKFGEKILNKFGLKISNDPNMSGWEKMVENMKTATKEVRIGVVGKYVEHGAAKHRDVYISIIQALIHAGAYLNVKPVIEQVQSSNLSQPETSTLEELKKYDGILVPGGFGSTGVEGKIEAIRYCREKNVPFLGLCYGMQLAVVEYARNVLGWNAHTTEIEKTEYPVIDILPEQKSLIENSKYGGTMRLGSYVAIIKDGTRIFDAYKNSNRFEKDKEEIKNLENHRIGIVKPDQYTITERHRHRYEVNPRFVKELENNGLIFSGRHVRLDGQELMEFLELKNHCCFLATQAHPEFKSRLENPSPIFVEFMRCAAKL